MQKLISVDFISNTIDVLLFMSKRWIFMETQIRNDEESMKTTLTIPMILMKKKTWT